MEQTSTSLGNIKGASALGQANAQDPTKNPVALGFQTGQAAAIDTQANAASVPLTERLALLQSNRKAQLDSYSTQLGFQQDKYNQENADWKANQAQKSAQEIAKQKSATDIQKAQISAASKKKTGSVGVKPQGNSNISNPITGQTGYRDSNGVAHWDN